MRSGGNDFDFFKLTKLANFVHFQCLRFIWMIGGGLGPLPSYWLRHCLYVTKTG